MVHNAVTEQSQILRSEGLGVMLLLKHKVLGIMQLLRHGNKKNNATVWRGNLKIMFLKSCGD